MTKKAYTYSVILLVFALILAACDSDDKDDNENTTRRDDEVSVQLKWLHNPQFAGFYAADRQGYYSEEKINVNLLPGGPEVDAFATTSSGQAQFGIGSGDFTIDQIVNKDQPFQIIGATYQSSPAVYIKMVADDNPPLEDTADAWRGLRVMPIDTAILMVGILDYYGLTVDDVQVMEANFDMNSFVEGTSADVRATFVTSDVPALREAGHEVQIFQPEDFGVLSYADVIYVNKDKASEDLIQRFMRATLKGWQYVVDNPDKVADLVLQYAPTSNAAQVEAVWNASLPLIDDGNGLLRVEESVIESTVDLMVKAGTLTEKPALDQLYTAKYLTSE